MNMTEGRKVIRWKRATQVHYMSRSSDQSLAWLQITCYKATPRTADDNKRHLERKREVFSRAHGTRFTHVGEYIPSQATVFIPSCCAQIYQIKWLSVFSGCVQITATQAHSFVATGRTWAEMYHQVEQDDVGYSCFINSWLGTSVTGVLMLTLCRGHLW